MLADQDEFDGGAFETLEVDGSCTRPEFAIGDVLVFPSHKYHCVRPVTAGQRKTLILEFWLGEERICPHRCEQHWGQCDYKPGADKWRRRLLDGPQGVVDPW